MLFSTFFLLKLDAKMDVIKHAFSTLGAAIGHAQICFLTLRITEA